MTCVTCGTGWRVELCDLATGVVKQVPQVISAEWQTLLNGVGQGSLILPTRQVAVSDIWPHLTSVYILRESGPDGASRDYPVVEFAGIIEQFEAKDNGATTVGMKSIEQYLKYRVLQDGAEYGEKVVDDQGTVDDTSDDVTTYPVVVDQNVIAASLVNHAQQDGIPLTGVAHPSAVQRYRYYSPHEDRNILDAVIELTQASDGPDWYLTHQKTDGMWATEMHFVDKIDGDPGLTLKSDREANGYSLTVDAADHATWVWSAGAGNEDTQITYDTHDPSQFYPRFDASPTDTGISDERNLREYAEGFLADHRDPYAAPEVVVVGLDTVPPAKALLGYTHSVEVCYGAVSYRGKARTRAIAWKLQEGSPVSRTFDLYPLVGNARDTVLNQTPCDEPCEDC